MKSKSTYDYIKTHIEHVQKYIKTFIQLLEERAKNHDKSKLELPEFDIWCKMDEEPQYKYGTPEYFEKINRYKDLFKHHYECNRHHPEHFLLGINDMNLIDLIEMLCDWLGYKDIMSINEAMSLIDKQMARYNFSDELRGIMFNTLVEYFSIMTNESDDNIPTGIEKELLKKDEEN